MRNFRQKQSASIFNKLIKGMYVSMCVCMAFTVKAQITYTFNYTGNEQTINLQPNTYTIETWGADGGDNLGNGSTTYSQNGGKGGYSVGVYTLASLSTIYVNVGGKGANSTSALNTTVSGGYNGGGYGSLNTTSGKSSGSGGGGASHVATATGVLSTLVSNQSAVRIVAGGGGGAGESNYANNNSQYNSNGGNGGGLSGLQVVASGYQGRHGQGGTQTAGGGGGDNGSAVAGVPLQGIFGAGGYNPISGNNTSAGGAGIGGGGGGWYGGGAGWGGAATSFQAGSGGGGSGYIGGVTNGTTIAFGQTGFVSNPDVTGNGYILIHQQSTPIFVTASSSVICVGGGPVTMTATGVNTYTWLPVGNFAGSNSANISVNPSSTTVYTVEGTDALGLSISTFTVYVNDPQVSVSVSNPVICKGQNSTLVASGASSYNWSSQSGGFSTVTSGTLVFDSNTMPGGTYNIVGTDSIGCIAPLQTAVVTVLSPSAVISGTNEVCKGKFIILTVSGANSYTWSTGANTTTVSISPSFVGVHNYSVVGSQSQDGVTCYSNAQTTITMYNSPAVTALSNRNPACRLELITLTAVASGATSYTWTNGTTSTLSSVWKTAPQTTPAQIYTITVSNQYGCSDSFTLEVKVNPCVGLDENTANTDISIYPNPNKGEFVISSEQAMDLQIINELGQVVKTLHINKNTTEVKLNDLSKGIYFIIGKTENGTVKEKIVIEK